MRHTNWSLLTWTQSWEGASSGCLPEALGPGVLGSQEDERKVLGSPQGESVQRLLAVPAPAFHPRGPGLLAGHHRGQT